MARALRLQVAGMPFHLVQRGNNRSACFAAANDYERYLALLRERSTWHGVAVHAYALMTNHVHLLMTPSTDDALTWMMKSLAQMYAQYINRKYRRTGSLWEGRFRACLIDSESYLLTCYRYIEANPVRAHMVLDAGDYPWSSYRANALGMANPILMPHPAFEGLGRTADERRAAYRELFEAPLPGAFVDEIRSTTLSGSALGTREFRRQIADRLGRAVEPKKRGPKRKLSV